jgi:hypothetical protein
MDSKQHRPSQKGGAQNVGHVPKARLHQPPNFMGKSGQGDNQSTSRGSGKT